MAGIGREAVFAAEVSTEETTGQNVWNKAYADAYGATDIREKKTRGCLTTAVWNQTSSCQFVRKTVRLSVQA